MLKKVNYQQRGCLYYKKDGKIFEQLFNQENPEELFQNFSENRNNKFEPKYTPNSKTPLKKQSSCIVEEPSCINVKQE